MRERDARDAEKRGDRRRRLAKDEGRRAGASASDDGTPARDERGARTGRATRKRER